jgi:DNA-binding NarL/FixJ family response regulator
VIRVVLVDGRRLVRAGVAVLVDAESGVGVVAVFPVVGGVVSGAVGERR